MNTLASPKMQPENQITRQRCLLMVKSLNNRDHFVASFVVPNQLICLICILSKFIKLNFFFIMISTNILPPVPPQIIPFTYEDVVNVGDSLDLFCQISKGDKPISIKWSFEGFHDNRGVQIKTKRISDKTSLLTISVASADHSGRYTCTASNMAATVSFSTNITVNGS